MALGFVFFGCFIGAITTFGMVLTGAVGWLGALGIYSAVGTSATLIALLSAARPMTSNAHKTKEKGLLRLTD